jgi:hypothetical protein
VNGILVDAKLFRALVSGHFALRLDTANASEITMLANADGGSVYADVISVFEAGLHFARKHPGLPKYEAFEIPIGVATSTGLFDWVAGSWGPSPEARDGALLGVDFNFNIKSEVGFSGALVVETRIPALDAASKEAGHLTVRLQPEFIDVKTPGTGKLSLIQAKQKLWRTSNFRLQIDGLDCKKVSRIDAFTVTRNVTAMSSGSGGVDLVPEKVEFPNLKITLSKVSAAEWYDWHESFVVNGNNDDSFERNGTISFLSTDYKTVLSHIDLHHLGIVRLASNPSDAITRVTAELYCEEMVLGPGASP